MKTLKNKYYFVIVCDVILSLIVTLSFLTMISVREETSGDFLLIDMIVFIVISFASMRFGTFKRISKIFDKIEKKLS